jgi:hypothetical protein
LAIVGIASRGEKTLLLEKQILQFGNSGFHFCL